MRRLRALRFAPAALLATVALVAAGCGGASGSGGGSGGAAAGLAPGNVLAFIAINTDFSSSQMTSAKDLIDKFPFGPKLLTQMQKSIGSDGTDTAKLKSSIGPELDLAYLTVSGHSELVGFTKPKDVSQFESTLKTGSSPSVYEEIGGWVAFSDKQSALDAVKNRTSNLSDNSDYQDGKKSLPSDALATVYVDKSAFALAGGAFSKSLNGLSTSVGTAASSKVSWLTAALSTHDQGVALEAHIHTTSPGPSLSSNSLESEIPSGALLALSGDLSSVSKAAVTQSGAAGAGTLLAPVQQALGVSLPDLLKAVSGPAILYVKPGAPIPEVTLAVKPADAQQAATTLSTLVTKLAKGRGLGTPVPVKVGDVTLQKLSLGPVAILFGVVDGQLVVTDSQTAVDELRSTSNKLADDDAFKAAKKASGLPDSNSGFLYVDLKDLVPAVEGLAALAQQTIPPTVDANLKPLRDLMVYGSVDGQTSNVVVFLQTN